jgi:hypothetical protein
MILLKTYFKHTVLFTLLFLISIGLHSQTKAKDGKEFPAPKDIKNLLFYVQRTNNINTLIYQLNYTDKNELNEKEPLKIYWKNYNTDGSTESLNAIQKKYAYGIETHVLDHSTLILYRTRKNKFLLLNRQSIINMKRLQPLTIN